MTETIERRETRGTVELRAAGPKGKKAGGYAIKFGVRSQNLGGFVERVDPSLVDETIDRGLDVLGRYQHDSNMLLGRTDAQTLRLTKDGVGLDYDVDLPDTSYARDLAVLLERGDVRGSSFAFRLAADGGDSWGETESGFPERTLLRGIIVDVAPVVTPAYLDTTSGLRSLAEQRGLDISTVKAAAAHDQLGQLLRAKDPKVVDLGPSVAVALRARLAKARMAADTDFLKQ